MKTTTRICAIAAFIFTLTLQAQVTKTVNTEGYDIIDVRGSMTVTLQRGTAEGAIQVIAEEQAHEYVDIDSNGTTLVLKLKKNFYKVSKKGVKIIVPYIALSGVHLKGSGDVICKNVINATTFETSLNGSGDIDLVIEADSTEANLTGSGDIDLSGTTNRLSVAMTGSGDFDSLQLATQDTEATLTGSGDISVNAQQSIDAVLKGSGDIEYSGNPETKNTKVYGSG